MRAMWIFISSLIVVILTGIIFVNSPTSENLKDPSHGPETAIKTAHKQNDSFTLGAMASLPESPSPQQAHLQNETSSFSNSSNLTGSPTQIIDSLTSYSPPENRDRSSKIVKPDVTFKTSDQATQAAKDKPGTVSGSSQFGGISLDSSNQKLAKREIVQNVPEGAKVPTVFYDDTEKPLPQQKALDRIAEEFEKNVSEVPPGLTQQEVWETARLIADERYITLFGYQAFNQYHLKAAKEALKEKKVRAAAAQITP